MSLGVTTVFIMATQLSGSKASIPGALLKSDIYLDDDVHVVCFRLAHAVRLRQRAAGGSLKKENEDEKKKECQNDET